MNSSRLGGEGVRYKAKLIGVDQVPNAQGDEMCWKTMKKLKDTEAAANRQGIHKQKVWLKVSDSGLKILDKTTKAVLYDHDTSRIRFLKKDNYDPRALAYIYQNQDTYLLFYIKMADQVISSNEVMETICSDPLSPQATWTHGSLTDDSCFSHEPTGSVDDFSGSDCDDEREPSLQLIGAGRLHGDGRRMLADVQRCVVEESVDIKALRAKFNNKASTSDNSSRDSSSPKSPRPGFGRAIFPVTENDLAHHRLSPAVPPPLMASPGLTRFPRAEPMAASIPSRPPPSFPRPPPNPGVRTSIQPMDTSKVKQTGEMLQNIMLRQQRPPGTKPAPAPAQAPAPAPASTPLPLRLQPRQRSAGEVAPLRRPLPPEGPLPLKPKRPPNVNLEPFMRFNRGPALPGPRKQDGSPGSTGRKMSLSAVISPPNPPQRSNKPARLQRQVASVDIEDDQETYDDIASFEKNESWSDNSSQCMDGDDEDVYESIDEDQVEANLVNAEKKNKKEANRLQAQQKKDQMERQKKENELRKNFQLQGEVEVLHTARVRHDWHGGGKLELSVRQGDSVEILRVNNNPGGKWLARSLNGNYGYISNSCVDVDYEAVKRKVLQSRKIDTSSLPPPPPDPPLMSNVESNNRDSMLEDDDDYDDVQPLTEDFPPPPHEISIDPKVMKELRKKFKYEGPLTALHSMMVNPNAVIKKPGSKDLPVTQGEVLDIIELTNSKKALCRNRFGKYGYVSRSLLLQMEGDIYDDVDYAGDIYDNDSPHTDY